MKVVQLNTCSLYIAESFWDKTRGVIGRESLLTNGLFLLPHCNWVHSFLLHRSLRIYFLSGDYRYVIDTAELKPNHFSRPDWNAVHTLEASENISSDIYQEVLLYLQHNKF